jgi:sucrose 6(F)-phosphate phosphorylase
MPVKNQVQLITYPDSLGGNLASLGEILSTYFAEIFKGGVHILPPYPSSADRGFAPRTYFEIEPQFGSWEDIRKIGAEFDVVLDLMVNHVSRGSVYFQDFLKKGRRSEYADLFITLDKIWPDGEPPAEDVVKIFLRRPEHPFLDVVIEESGQTERIWASFGAKNWSEQIDIDVNSPSARQLFIEILQHMSRQGVKILRLDAIAYVTKKPGTNCFFVEPEIYSFLNWIQGEAHGAGIELLPELHAHFSLQERLAEHGFWVYNFVLPLLILHTLAQRNSKVLKEHLQTCPRRQFTMLDCHDGIPVQPDLDGILTIDEAQEIVHICLERGANLNRILSTGHKKRPDFDAHQINCTYYSSLDCNDDAYIAARAIQFFSPGVPQVYYVGLLAGENDPDEVQKTGEGRAINRHNYSLEEMKLALNKPVVGRLLDLIRFRNEYGAFDGEFEVGDSDDRSLVLTWRKEGLECTLSVALESMETRIEFRDSVGKVSQYDP